MFLEIMLIVEEAFSLSVELIQSSTARTDPQYSRAILVNAEDVVVAQAVAISGVMLVVNELPRLWIKSIEASSPCPDPQRTGVILVNATNVVVAKAIGILGIVPEHGEAVSIELVQSVLGSKPHKSLAVLEDALYRALGEALLDREPLEQEHEQDGSAL